ncbi:hypothetical protein LCGC14_2587030 [marine sediment metagenome]|uniref:Uncharacterized protein n=1 Tax=marine sediment metagenome TaxID=412755 RepID=A0A0F9D5I9_9ZZZZ
MLHEPPPAPPCTDCGWHVCRCEKLAPRCCYGEHARATTSIQHGPNLGLRYYCEAHAYRIRTIVGFRDAPQYPSIPRQRTGVVGDSHAFRSFQCWLKREPFHRRGEYCSDEDCIRCAAWRDIAQANKKLQEDRAKLDAERLASYARRDISHVRELTLEEGRSLFRKQCWRYLGVSAEEFVRKWEAGELPDDSEWRQAMRVAMLLPLFDKRKAP